MASHLLDGQPTLHRGSIIAVDLEEMFMILKEPAYVTYGVEIVEICGGNALTSHMCVRRQLRSGHCFELTTGTDLTDPGVQRRVMDYIRLARPLVIVMSPVCTPFGPLGSRNYILHHEAWGRSFATAAPLAQFCGEVALHQIGCKRYFLNEQPYPSKMYELSPWPRVRAHATCMRIIFHQCALGLRVDNLLCKKPTEFVSNSKAILQKFVGLQCNGQHQHACLLSGKANHARLWPPALCDRIASGIEAQVRESARASQALAYPTVASGTGDEGATSVPEKGDEPWRKCKGCLWRLQRAHPMHNRQPGICKYPNDEAYEFPCPGCKARKNRADESHTFGPDCRHALTKERRKATQRRPFARRPARDEPTAGLKASGLGRQAENAAEEAEAEERKRLAAAEPARGSRDPEPSDTEVAPVSDEEGADASVGRGRGPDQEPRVRRAFREAPTQTPQPSDWSSFDIQATLRGLRYGTEADHRRLLRKLHIRWWHASAERMRRLLSAANVPKSILDLIVEVTDTCKVCRHWSRPSPDARPSCRMVIGFNIEIEGDLMFYRHKGAQRIILVLVCRGVRWTASMIVSDKQTTTLLNALDQCWIAIFGPPQVLLFDGETGLDDDESTAFCQLRGITKRTAAPRQHTRIVDRKIAVLRDSLHKLTSQLDEEGLEVPLVRVLSDATYALNALTSVNGCSPYTAVLGRVPALLPPEDAVLSDGTPDVCSRHTYRLREIAVQAIAEGTARDRMRRALKTQTKPAAEEMEYKVGQHVDWFREPSSKDASGWRGPGVIADLTRLEHGRVGVRTSTDQVITVRLQDLRPSLTHMSEDLCDFFHVGAPVATAGSTAHEAQQFAQECADHLKSGAVLTLGQVRTSAGVWVETPQTELHRQVLQACLFVAETVFKMTNVVAARVARGIRILTARDEYEAALSIWWTAAGSRQLNFVHSPSSKLSTVDMVGQLWPEVRVIQLLTVADEDDWVATQRWTVPNHSEASTQSAQTSSTSPQESSPHASAQSDSVGRLSAIPEATSEEAESNFDWSALVEMFGSSITPQEAEWLQQAYAAVATEEAPARSEPLTLEALATEVQALPMQSPEIPEWSQAQNLEAPAFLSEEQLATSLSKCEKSPDSYDLLDADETGAYVALEIYGDLCKTIEGLDRIPNSDEHVEIRLYETHTRKAVIDRSDDLLTQEELVQHAEAVTQATIDELKTWQGFRCFERRRRSVSPCVIDAKWVYKFKIIKGERRIRARLCLRGFKETGADSETNYSATASRFSQRLLVSECVLRQWCLASADVPKAFLQGVSYAELAQETQRPMRDVSFELSGEGLACLRLLPGYEDFCARTEVLHCLKPGTGCRDAPKCFSLKLRQATSTFGFKQSSVDGELELLFKEGVLLMLILKHVDDLKMAGPKKLIAEFVEHLSKVFGKMDIDWHEFTFCGVRHSQAKDGSVSLDQAKFLAACRQIMQPAALTGGPTAVLPESARRHFLSLLMTVAYSLLTRPDAAVFITALQRESHRAQVVHVKRLNQLLAWMQANPRKITYPVMEYPDCLLQISDSSYKAKSETGLSVRGMVSLRISKGCVAQGMQPAPCHLLDYASKQQRHVTRSTFSSELFAATDAVDVGLLNIITLHELKVGVISAEQAKDIIEGKVSATTELGLVIDARSVSSATVAPTVKVPAEPSLLLHVNWLRQLLMRKRLGSLWWSDTRSMVADALTKGAVSRELIIAVMSGTLWMYQPYEQQSMQP